MTSTALDVHSIIDGLTSLQDLALRTARPDVLTRFAGEPCPTTPVLDCPGNVTRALVRKGLAAHGGEIGPAKVTVLTVTGERVRDAILARN